MAHIPVHFVPSRARAHAPVPDTASAGQRPWQTQDVAALFDQPLPDLMFQAQQVHRAHHDATKIQLSTLLSIKTGGCPEDCGYCSQSVHADAGVTATKLMPLDDVLQAASAAKARGATRFCMGAAWRSPHPRDMAALVAMIGGVRSLGLDTCMTLGMLSADQAQALGQAGLDYYNHNLDTSAQDYARVISSRTHADRLDTLHAVRTAGIKVCCGGIVGMGETRADRVGLLTELANLQPYPESVPINQLVPVPGTRLGYSDPVDPFEFVRTVAVARITMPMASVRLSAGRAEMDDATQALCFLAGANAIFYGDQLLTTANPAWVQDQQLLQRLGLRVQASTSSV